MKISEFSIKFNKKSILELIDCYEDSPIYEEVSEEFDDMVEEAYAKIKPYALLEFGEITENIAKKKIPAGTKALYAITTVGAGLSEWSTKLFAEGNYLAGMLADGMADDYLFQMDHSTKDTIIKECKKKGMGISKRLEAPIQISMEAQKVAWEVTKAKEILGIDIKESFMYDPVKTLCNIFILEEGLDKYKAEHNCRNCNSIHCKRRNVLPVDITVKGKEETYVIQCKENQSIMEAMKENGKYINAVCAGRGTCGKCKVLLIDGQIKPSDEDIRWFTSEELELGYRLSCKAIPNDDCIISLESENEEDFYVVTDYEKSGEKAIISDSSTFGIGIDIGSTTIAMQLIDMTNESIIDTYTTINKQRAYGADVISRIEVSNSGKLEELKESIQKDLKKGIEHLIDKSKVDISKITIAGNTTMVHLLMGYSCEGLGVFPFTPVNVGTISTSYADLIADDSYEIPVTIMPGISTFVGGDITSGLFVCEFHKQEKTNLLIDLGTNGEMAIGNKDKILVTSTAAGPAFEGGNITCGMGSVQGAICNVSINGGVVTLKTIGDKAPIGICGTGVIESTLELLKEGLVDETGLLEEDSFEDGYLLATSEEGKPIVFTQKDVREIQLAKAAVRAGLETLLLRMEVTYDQVDKVYLAGGFGYKIDIEKAIGIGLLPKEFSGKVKAIGNSSLSGTLEYMKQANVEESIEKILKNAREINLSNDKDFNDLYMDHMFFEEE